MANRTKEPNKKPGVSVNVKKDPVIRKNLLLRYPFLWLILIPVIVYIKTITFQLTKLDDQIFIKENQIYNSGFKNIPVSFHRGLFNPKEDIYYRPLFLVDFILESKIFGIDPHGYHLTNLLYHIISVVLLFIFFRKLKIPDVDSLILTTLFAVHPVLTGAVAWIPGRNDMLLMIFFLSGLLLSISYTEKPGWIILAGQFILALLAVFIKETAMIIPLITLIILLFFFKPGWKRLLPVMAVWVVAVLIWIVERSTAPAAMTGQSFREMFHSGIARIPAIIQYIGKILLPVNLSVFPIVEDTTLVWGMIATIGIIALLILSKSYFKPLTLFGIFWFLVFLLPVLIVPKYINDQVFEHRLYIPIIGILLILSQTSVFKPDFSQAKKFLIYGIIILGFSTLSFIRSDYYAEAVVFWNKAVKDSPHSATAKMILGTKVESDKDREWWFLQAYAIDPKLKNLNYYLGKVMMEKKNDDSAAMFLRREAKIQQLGDVYFLLAQTSFSWQKLDSAAYYLEQVIRVEPVHPQANFNLAMLYFQLGKNDKGHKVIENMKVKGMEIPEELVKVNTHYK
ncbi:MAG: hypothetical protein NTX61_01980 [Bacteroidetes bacterium]|nr:hypothetical protein [Bacteroidota bacterium]